MTQKEIYLSRDAMRDSYSCSTNTSESWISRASLSKRSEKASRAEGSFDGGGSWMSWRLDGLATVGDTFEVFVAAAPINFKGEERVGVPLLPVNRFRFIRLEDGDDMGEDKLPKLKLLTRVKVLINLIFSDNDKTSPPTSGPPPPPPPALLVTDLLQMVDILLRVI